MGETPTVIPDLDTQKISRRGFLKRLGALISLSFVPTILKSDTRTRQEESKAGLGVESEYQLPTEFFFQDITLFTPEVSEYVQSELRKFPELFQIMFEELNLDNVEWQESADNTILTLERMKKVYDSLPNKNDPDALYLLQRDFTFLASKAWAVLRVIDLYKDSPESFSSQFLNAQSPHEIGYTDALIGDDIYAVTAPWANIWRAEFVTSFAGQYKGVASIISEWTGLESGVITPLRMSRSTGELRDANNQWRLRSSHKEMPNIAFDKETGDPSVVTTEDQMEKSQELLEIVREILRPYGLDRAVSTVSFFDSEHGLSGVHSDRNITISSNDFSQESFRDNPETWSLVVLHEVAHAIFEAIQYFPTDELAFKHRLAAYKIIKDLRSSSSLQRFFNPRGKIGPLLNEAFIADDLKSGARDISEASITQYSANLHSIFTPALGYLRWAAASISGTRWNDTSETLVYRLFDTVITSDENENGQPGSFSEYWNTYWRKAVQQLSQDLHPLEILVFSKIDEDPQLFDASKRSFYDESSDMRDYMSRKVIPMVLQNIALESPKEFVSAYVSTSKDAKMTAQMKHQLSFLPYEMRLFDNELITFYDSNIERGGTDTEPFAEIFQSALRRNNPEVNNQIPESTWVKVDKMINELLEDLKSTQLAQIDTQVVL